MLETCSNISEAIELLKQHNINGFKRHHIMIVDSSGDSVILEWGRDSLSVVKKTKDYQVMTNFNNTNPGLAGWYPCNRYEIVEDKLETLTTISIDEIRTILKAVKNTGMNYPTVYSNIYDIENKQIYLFHNHNFEEFFLVDTEDELEKGEHSYYIPYLFSNVNMERLLDNEKVSTKSVELKWQGNADSYKLYVSTSRDFKTCKPIKIQNESSMNIKHESNLSLFLLFLFPVFLIAVKHSKTHLLILLFFLFTCCITDRSFKGIKEIKRYSYTFTNLEPGKIYYWKITAIKNTMPNTTSIVKQFSTLPIQ